MILDNGPYLVAFVLTASIHLSWPSIPSTIHQQFYLLASTRPSAVEAIIKLHMFALVLLAFSLSFKTASAASVSGSEGIHIYNFDDLDTANGFGHISAYDLLTLTGFSVIAPRDPELPYIQPSDRNCAISSPNALLGSRYGPSERRPTIAVNETATTLNEIHPSFQMHSISIKPLAMPIDPIPVLANLTIRGWPADNIDAANPLTFHVDWTSGYTEPLTVNFSSEQFSKFKWEALGSLDIAVDFGPGQLDWEFCVDDLTVGFTGCGKQTCEGEEKHERSRQAKTFSQEEL